MKVTKKLPLKMAISRAIDYCIKNGILKEYLLGHKAEVAEMFLTEYNEQEAREALAEEAREDGLERGLQEGRKLGLEQGLEQGLKQGMEQGLTVLIRTLLPIYPEPEQLSAVIRSQPEYANISEEQIEDTMKRLKAEN